MAGSNARSTGTLTPSAALTEYGTTDFTKGFAKEFEKVKAFVVEAAHPPKPAKDPKKK